MADDGLTGKVSKPGLYPFYKIKFCTENPAQGYLSHTQLYHQISFFQTSFTTRRSRARLRQFNVVVFSNSIVPNKKKVRSAAPPIAAQVAAPPSFRPHS